MDKIICIAETGEKINQNLTANLEAQHLDRRSSGCGDSLESNPELGMNSHEMSLITIFGHKHFMQKFYQKC